MTPFWVYVVGVFFFTIMGTAVALVLEGPGGNPMICLFAGSVFGILWPLFVFVYFPAKKLSRIMWNEVRELDDKIERERNAS
jgi:hypothetical protein